MPFVRTYTLGETINGNTTADRLIDDYAWFDAAYDLSAPSSGPPPPPAPGDPGAVGGPSDGPNDLVWRQSGAPFGSLQTQHAVSAGALPPGVKQVQKEVRALIQPGSINPWPVGILNEFALAGVPTAVGVYTGNFAASGAFGGDSFSITIAMQTYGGGSTCPLIGLTDTLTDGFNGVPYSRTIVASNGVGTYDWDVASGSLPPGLSLNASTGVVSGTPTTNGVYVFTIRARDDNGCPGARQFTVEISNPERTQIRGSTQIKRGSVTEFELHTSVAGPGLSGGDGDPLEVEVSGTGGLEIVSDALKIKLDGSTLTLGSSGTKVSPGIFIRKDGTEAFTADQSFGGFKGTNVATPTAGTDIANKDYVDAFAMGLTWKNAVRLATTANHGLSGLADIDGVTPAAGDRILVKSNAAGAQNGIYVAAAGAWARSEDANVSAEVKAGMAVPVAEGTVNADKTFVLTTNDPITLGTTALVFTSISATGTTDTSEISVLTNGDATNPEIMFDATGDVIMTGV